MYPPYLSITGLANGMAMITAANSGIGKAIALGLPAQSAEYPAAELH
jgi:hypothetical protein